MTTEEKAKAYDEAIGKAAALYKASEPMSGCNVILETLFPELKESEDERIRKELIDYINRLTASPNYIDKYNAWITWLEKQDKQIDIANKEYWRGYREGKKEILDKYAEIEKQDKQKPIEIISAEESLGIDSDTYNKIIDACIYEDDKIEQKPEENKGNIGGISANSEWCEENEPHKELAESYLAKFDEKFPILPTLKGKQLADYKNFLNKCQQIFGLKYWGIRPIQAKLFEKLSLLWAAWGAEHLQELGQTDGDMDNEISMWSEEDDITRKALINLVEMSYGDCIDKSEKNRLLDWLKSLRPQNNITDEELAQAKKSAYNDALDKIEYHSGEPTFDDGWSAAIWYLKKRNAQPQNRWKPSDEQIETLDFAADCIVPAEFCIKRKVLKELLEQLKKLKEE